MRSPHATLPHNGMIGLADQHGPTLNLRVQLGIYALAANGPQPKRQTDFGDFMGQPDFLDAPPESTSLTDYDRRHLKLYARLLDAQADGATWEEAFKVLFASAGPIPPERAKRIHDAHLKRAEWITSTGFTDLLSGPRH